MTDEPRDPQKALKEAALHFHQHPKPGKIEIVPTKPLANQRDLALAYSPGVAAPCEEIAADPETAALYTSRGNLVAVISNGTAVLGLGNIGALASKPVMEGKSVLFKKFAGIDSIDIEIDEQDPKKFIETVAPMWPSFGGINLEDIKAPDCFEIEEALRERMPIPVFHDDQHGTAIIVAAAVLNGLKIAGKDISKVKICTSGAGAAAIACLNMLMAVGAKRENIWVADREGLVTTRRDNSVDRWRGAFAQDSDKTSLAEVMEGADIFLGLSAAGALKREMLKDMAENPLILALSNPVPEIMPEIAIEERPDAMICTGRSDYPNQVNNVLCFPFIFRGALDVGATTINEEMKAAAAHAIAKLAHEPVLESVPGSPSTFGRDYLIPNPFDQRLILRIAPAVAKAAMDSGVARRPVADFDAYKDSLNRFVFRSGMVMKPMIERAKGAGQRIAFADGEDERVLRATQVVLEEGIAQPILIGRPFVIEQRIERFGLQLTPGKDFEIINPEDDPRYKEYVAEFHSLVGRSGVTPDTARTIVRTNTTIIGALAVKRGDADGLICGLQGRYIKHVRDIKSVVGLSDGVSDVSALSMLIMPRGAFFLADTYVNMDPSADEIVSITLQARDHLRRFNIEAKAALLSYSNFGSREGASSDKMKAAYDKLKRVAPDLIVEGEMQGDLALNQGLRERYIPDSVLKGEANLLVFPNLESANLSMTLLKELNNALPVGPILMGTRNPAHILAPSVTSRGIVNMTAITANESLALKR
ncbi:NADP-dependent malic enzyme [Pelagibacterium halotolerans]|uniref:NADP-dependent malic enzyme n=1 Tax=Pelagibacterium halotolerans (strain DSM 22347 / JCM 15775 / CGMCC 1.7692 / B2) TaxID=1082931 RepID=G4RB98_PELHB|nr:NADP-dependent malic enzyme [Pelagibacterium halotolerans]AEQ51596.1 NADP-dependent malic enzyme [Pelagibacterium halotolerans B2]QJR18575.1 NADP-dependent malic enzyme [Pelagibacterium halotolerans]SEA17762.1 malate dehydrogenase (oxaloacetate-decarboxylating)(NADP+) [Pelagibacterium halotolerans]